MEIWIAHYEEGDYSSWEKRLIGVFSSLEIAKAKCQEAFPTLTPEGWQEPVLLKEGVRRFAFQRVANDRWNRGDVEIVCSKSDELWEI